MLDGKDAKEFLRDINSTFERQERRDRRIKAVLLYIGLVACGLLVCFLFAG